VFGPCRPVRFADVTPRALLNLFPFKPTYWETTTLLRSDWVIIQAEAQSGQRSYVESLPHLAPVIERQRATAVPLRDLDLSSYDIVISLEPCLSPLRQSSVAQNWFYFHHEHSNHWYNRSRREPAKGYIAFLDHMCGTTGVIGENYTGSIARSADGARLVSQKIVFNWSPRLGGRTNGHAASQWFGAGHLDRDSRSLSSQLGISEWHSRHNKKRDLSQLLQSFPHGGCCGVLGGHEWRRLLHKHRWIRSRTSDLRRRLNRTCLLRHARIGLSSHDLPTRKIVSLALVCSGQGCRSLYVVGENGSSKKGAGRDPATRIPMWTS
jgi:hypothetical protein